MATIATAGHKTAALPTSLLLAPFRAVGRFLVRLAEASPQMRALNHLSTLSDEELATKGVTRESEIRRILGAASAL